jgi:alanyl-tRNA synthetase
MEFREIRAKFLDYFKAQGHEIVRSSSLIPRDDPSLMFTNSGMVQFKNLFLGKEKRAYTRATSSQKCVRAGGKHNDLDNVGYTARHHTFFEMLGNFSFGDYFKKEAIAWGWDLLTNGYKLPADRLYASIYQDDDEAFKLWQQIAGLPAERIIRLGEKDNFWAMGDTGPCGPCSEILIDQGPTVGCGRPECGPGCDCDRYLEIWNLVFTQFDRDASGKLTPLPNPNIDTGMGLERLAAVVQGVTSTYDTDLFQRIILRIEEIAEKKYRQDKKADVSFRVISDHSRSAAFLICDGVMPSNEGRGYVLRRIIRRAIRFGQALGIREPFLHQVADRVIAGMGRDYEDLVTSRNYIETVILNEEKRFADTLRFGMQILEEELQKLKDKKQNLIPGDLAFKLYDTYGLSVDLVEDVAREEGFKVDLAGYRSSMAKQKSLSQQSWKGSGEAAIPETFHQLEQRGVKSRFIGYESLQAEAQVLALVQGKQEIAVVGPGAEVDVILDQTPFYGEAGGQAGDRGWLTGPGLRLRVCNALKFSPDFIVLRAKVEEGTIKINDTVQAQVDGAERRATALNHTATHLLHAALREVLGDHVKQAGSMVSAKRLRFDFSHFTQVDPERLRAVETLVNRHIRANHGLRTDVMDRDAAMKTGAMAIFEERYDERVRLVRVGDSVSLELCGGTHTAQTGDIGLFKILSESAVGANVRRIEALTGQSALEYVQSQEDKLKQAALVLKTIPEQLIEKAEHLFKEQKDKDREIESLKAKLLSGHSVDLLAGMKQVKGINLLVKEVTAVTPKELRDYVDRIKEKLGSGIVVLGARQEGKAMLICLVTADLTGRFQAGKIISRLSVLLGGKGGGRPDMAQGGGSKPEELTAALLAVENML